MILESVCLFTILKSYKLFGYQYNSKFFPIRRSIQIIAVNKFMSVILLEVHGQMISFVIKI